MDSSQARLLAAARSCAGVKWCHRGRNRNGLDCAGLVWLAYAECGVILPDRRDYGKDPFRDGLMSAAVRALGEPIWQGPKGGCRWSMLRPADVVVMARARLPRHVAMIGDNLMHGLSVIDADGFRGCVGEQGLHLDDVKSIVAVFRRPLEVSP